MKTNRQEIFDYIDGSCKDREEFEKKLSSDLVLFAEYKEIVFSLNKIDENCNVEIEDSYYASLIPKVRNKLEKKNIWNSRRLVFGFSSLSAVIIIYFITSLNISTISKSDSMLTEMLEDYESSEVLDLLDENNSLVDLYSTVSEGTIINDFDELSDLDNGNQDYVNGVSSLYSNYYIDNASEEEIEEVLKIIESKNYF